MKFQQLLTPLALATLALGGPPPKGPKRALYILDSDPAGAALVSAEIAPDGTLSKPTRTSTGGLGLIGLNANGPVPNDSLFTQNSVVVSGNRLFTVNAGSNTLAVFEIPKNDPLNPVLLGKPIDTVGDVPTTVAYSDKNKLACVAHTGTRVGVQCFAVSSCGSLKPVGNFLPLPLNQTNPPLGPVSTVSDIQFNPSQTALFVAVKGNGADKGGFIAGYPVAKGRVVEQPVISTGEDLLVLFGFSFIGGDRRAVISDAAFGASLVDIAPDLSVSVTRRVTIENQGAICWTAYSQRYNAAYIFDSLRPGIPTLDPATGNEKFVIPLDPTAVGTFDAALDRNFLYVLLGPAAVAVIDLTGSESGKKIPSVKQTFDISSVSTRQGLIGLAIYK